MKTAAYITTSWDDGHPLDLRVAEMLAKHGLRGTFYVPRTTEHGTMTPAQVRELSCAFEIGGHTLHHKDLSTATEPQAWQEIDGCRSWLEDNNGKPCRLFCPPLGKYSSRDLELVHRAGFVGLRSVELLSLSFPRRSSGLLLLPTTVQAHPHGLIAYGKNLLKRTAVRNLWLYIAHGRSTDWVRLGQSFLYEALKRGGVFHLWGHSWELEHTGQWQRLEEVLRILSQFTDQAPALTNAQVCHLMEPAAKLAAAPGKLAPCPTFNEVP